MNYRNYLATLFISASIIFASLDEALGNTIKGGTLIEEVRTNEAATPITIAEYMKLSPEKKSEVLFDLLQQYVNFLRSPTQGGQDKPINVYKKDISRAKFVIDLFLRQENGKTTIKKEAFDELRQLFVVAEKQDPNAPLINVLGYFIDKKYSEHKASLNGGPTKNNQP